MYATEIYSHHWFLESYPNKNFLSFYGEFMTNFCISDYIGTGKSAAMDKGTVQEIRIYRDNWDYPLSFFSNIFMYYNLIENQRKIPKKICADKSLDFENRSRAGLFETLLQNSFQQNKDWNNKKNKGGKYIIRTEDDWDKKLKPDMKYYRGWHLIVLVVLMLVNAYMEIKWLFFS